MVADISQEQQEHMKPPIVRNESIRTKDQQRSVPLKVIGNYSMQQSIGKGSMGKVKLAVHNVTGEKIAIKIVPRANLHLLNQPAHTNGKTMQQIAKEKAREENREVRTIREAHIMMLLKHPNIVGLKDLVIQGQYFYILMDYVGGGQLLHYIVKRQRLSDRRTRQFSRQIVSALDYLHRNSIVHRDLKIENIMIDKSGRNIKIIDFGLSNLFCPERQLTTFCGSLYFAAPELLNAHPYSGPEVDVWSLGVVIYVMATGSVPFDDKSMPGLHEKIKKGEVTYPAHLSNECKNLLSRIFVTDPKNRIIMNDIIHHPWMNRDTTVIKNYMPTRKPLTLPLNPKVIERMSQGFNLGTTEEIEKRLTLIIQSPVYHDAVRHISDCHARKTVNEDNFIIYDDPQSVPAAYHPFLSLYNLSAERQLNMEYETQHRVSVKSSLSRKASIESLGGASSANGSQTSLVEENTGARLLTEVPLNHIPVIVAPPHNGSGVKLNNEGSLFGYASQPAAIGSTNYLSRIQRWLRSSLSQHHLASSESAHPVSAPPSPPQRIDEARLAEIDALYPSDTHTSASRLPTPSHSTDDRENTSPNDSFQSAFAEPSDENKHSTTNAVPAGGSKSLFRKLSQAFLRKNSSRSLNKKTSNLSNSTNPNESATSEDDVLSTAISGPNKPTDQDVPPPVPPKDAGYTPPVRGSSMNDGNKQQQLPPGMSIATVTSRQTAHTVDISAITLNPNRNSYSINNQQTGQISTPIAAKMAKYEDAPQTQQQPLIPPQVSRSASLAAPSVSQYHHRRRGSVSKITAKVGSWLNRSNSLKHNTKTKEQT